MAANSCAEDLSIDVQIAPAFAPILAQDRLRAVAESALCHEGRVGSLTLVITDDRGIQALNRDFLGRDAPTDVLAFAAQEEAGPFVSAPEASGYLGDVIVSYPRAVAQAGELGHPVEEELDLLIVHGVLHLLGHDHTTEGERAAMCSIQEAILRDERRNHGLEAGDPAGNPANPQHKEREECLTRDES
jgi:probable rRNA maturation factor